MYESSTYKSNIFLRLISQKNIISQKIEKNTYEKKCTLVNFNLISFEINQEHVANRNSIQSNGLLIQLVAYC